LELVVARDITRHTIPTYQYLQNLLGRRGIAGRGVGFMRLLARTGLLGYTLLAFRKPIA